jgi:hypothetical protein
MAYHFSRFTAGFGFGCPLEYAAFFIHANPQLLGITPSEIDIR